MEVDDLAVGQWVTPRLEVQRRRHDWKSGQDQDGGPVRVREFEAGCRVREGVPLKVLGISLPFVVCGVLVPGGQEIGPEIIDVRSVRLVTLEPSYVQAIIDFKDPEDEAESNSEIEMDGIGVE